QPGVLHQNLRRRGRPATRGAPATLRDAHRPPGQRQRTDLGRRQHQGPHPSPCFKGPRFEPCALGAPDGSRTRTASVLSRPPLPLGYGGTYTLVVESAASAAGSSCWDCSASFAADSSLVP